MNIKDMCDSEINGRVIYSTWRKNASLTTTANAWYDLSQAQGSNSFNYGRTPLTSHAMSYLNDGGMFVGYNSTSKKYLRTTTLFSLLATGLPMTLILCDYLMFYPFIQENTLSNQTMINNISLPRYTDGLGVKVMPVSQTNVRTGGYSFTITYTNERGMTGRTATCTENAAVGFGNILSSSILTTVAGTGPFMTLMEDDWGVRTIDSVTMQNTDVGAFSLVLVKPIAQTQIRGIDAPVEKDYFLETGTAPEIRNNACLDWIGQPTGNLVGTILMGDIKIIW